LDSLITAAARRLAAGDALGALNLVALRRDAAGLALRGIAMAQLGDFERARDLLRRAARKFGPREATERAQCVVALAEIALASRDLSWADKALAAARRTLERRGDRVTAAHAHYLEIRKLLLTGKLDRAESEMRRVPEAVPLALKIVHELIAAQIHMRRLQPATARTALQRAARVAQHAGIAALTAEVETALAALDKPAARRIARGRQDVLLLDGVAALLGSDTFVVDGCRQVVHHGEHRISLQKRPVLLALACALAEAWPEDVSRERLVERAFQMEFADESLRARLRVDIGRLRRLLRGVADVTATPRGFALAPHGATEVAVLAPPVEGEHARVLALLADGESWSTSALAQALGTSQRTVQRSLDALGLEDKVQSIGRGRSRRWMLRQALGFTTLLLLPAGAGNALPSPP
jgi:hypothetical protein